ncbi:DUF3179 domain-containing protein [Aquicoccus sp. SU-CL01552]|uniref:DUF3179 domain-containing protein n=1 Tax=Aquicoccus sp. SU-CL01552 TaxID=3127656 RepID=UPI00310B96B7
MPLRFILAALWLTFASTTGALSDPARWAAEWPRTDFTTTSLTDWDEIRSGGPPRDGIPALSDPAFWPVTSETRLAAREPVIALELDGSPPRAYPLRYLTWHEIVNDRIGGVPVAVTFCPLCNSAITFDRRTAQGTLVFGVSGKLRHSDMVMYDRQTESWWQQARGEAIVGALTGTRLETLPSWVESWAVFRARNPDGLVMEEPAFPRAYGRNPYQGYDRSAWPFLYSGERPPHGIEPLARVVRVGDRAWPLARLRAAGEISEDGITLSWRAGLASALDSGQIAKGREVGMIRVRDGAGRDLSHDLMFAFAFHAFWPEGRWMLDGVTD